MLLAGLCFAAFGGVALTINAIIEWTLQKTGNWKPKAPDGYEWVLRRKT